MSITGSLNGSGTATAKGFSMAVLDDDGIREKVKRIIFNVTRIPVERIGDDAAFRQDLELDSLSLLEIGVDLDYEFQLGLEDLEQRLGDLPTVRHVVGFVRQRLAERAVA
jgi:acyl carrier protein